MKQTNWAPMIAGQAGVVPLSLGIPGVAKTAYFEALAGAVNRRFLPYMLSQVLPEDLGGFPVVREVDVNGDTYSAMARVPDETRLRAELESSVVLLDELTCAPQATQAAALQWVNNPTRKSWMFAAANPPEQAAAGVQLAPPMVNRLCVLPWETPKAAILEGLRNGLEFPVPDVPVVPDNWREYLAKWGLVVAEFLERFPDLFEAYPRSKGKACEPYPTPRSWTNTAKLLAACESVGGDKLTLRLLVEGCVGHGAAMQFQAHLDSNALPSPEEILADPKAYRLPARGDLAMAMIRATNAAVENNSTAERWERLCDFWEHVHSQSKELAIAGWKRLWEVKPTNYMAPVRSGPAWDDVNAIRSGRI